MSSNWTGDLCIFLQTNYVSGIKYSLKARTIAEREALYILNFHEYINDRFVIVQSLDNL